MNLKPLTQYLFLKTTNMKIIITENRLKELVEEILGYDLTKNIEIIFKLFEITVFDMGQGYLFTKIKGKSGGKYGGEVAPKMLVSLVPSERLFLNDI